MKNTFGWMHLQSSAVVESSAFYAKLFDWDLDPKGMENDESYTEIDAGEGACAGISHNVQAPPMWVPFVNVADIHESSKKAEELGANLLTEVSEIGEGMGWYSVIQDPVGAVIGLYQPPEE